METAGRLSAAAVEEVFTFCLFSEGERTDGYVPAEGVDAQAASAKVGFHSERLAASKDRIASFLGQIDDNFLDGWTFLNACVDKHGHQWGEHGSVNKLFMLGTASGLAVCVFPRDVWPVLPGGMPYYQVLSNTVKEVEGD